MVLPFVPLSLPAQPQRPHQKMKERGGGGGGGGGEWAGGGGAMGGGVGGAGVGGGGKRTQPRHKVVFDLHLQHLALHQLPSMSSTAKGRERGGGGAKGEREGMGVGMKDSTSNQLPPLPEALLWQGSETRGALKFRLRLRSPPSICLLLDDSHHEIVIPLSNITSLQLLDAPNANSIQKEGEETNEQEQQQSKERETRVGLEDETLEEMESRLRLGGMVLEMGIVQGCQKDFRLREPNRYVRLSSLPGSARVAAGDATVEEGDFTGGAAKLTNLVRMTIHSTVTRELTTAMTSLVVRALKVRDGQAVDLSVFGGHLTHLEQMGGTVPSSSGSGVFPIDFNTSGTESEQSDGSSSEGKREPVVLFVKKGGAGLPRYRIAEEEGSSTSKRTSSIIEEKGKQQSNQIVVEEETSSPVEMVFEEDESRPTATSHPLPLRPSPPTEPRHRAVTQPPPPTTLPPTLVRRQTIQEDVVFINNPPPPPASKQPTVVASLGSPRLSHAEYTNAHTRLATTPLSIFDARFLSNQTNSSSNPPSTSTSSSLPSTQKHSRTSSIATLVLPPSPTLSSANLPLSSLSSPTQQLHQRASTVSLGAIGDSRPTHRLPHASSRTRSVTDGSLLASAVARASAKALERGTASSSSPTSPTAGNGFGTREEGSSFVGQQPQLRQKTPTTATSSSSAFPPLDRIFSEGRSFAYQYPSPMYTPSSTCLSLSEEEENVQFDEGRVRTSSFASSEEGPWYGRDSGSGLGFGRPLGGRGRVESGRSIWADSDEGGGGPNNKDSDASSVWGAAAGGGVTRFASSSFFSSTSTNTHEEDFYPTPTPTYAAYPSSSSSHLSSERRRSSLPLNGLRSSSINFPLPATPPSPLPHQHLPSFLRGSTPDFLGPSSSPSHTPPPNNTNDAFGRTRSAKSSHQRPTTPRPSTKPKSQPLPPPPSTLLRVGDQKPVLPFYQLIDPRGGGASSRGGTSTSNSNSSVHSRWVSSSS